MKFTAFVTSLFLVGSEAFAPSAEVARSSTGKFDLKRKAMTPTCMCPQRHIKLDFSMWDGNKFGR